MSITLRFTKPWLNAISPVKLRFVDTGNITVAVGVTIPVTVTVTTVVNEIPIDRSFGIELGFSWADLNPLQQALLLANAVTDHTIEIAAAHDSIAPINTDVWLGSHTGPSIDIHHITPLLTIDLTGETFYVSWALPGDYQIVTAAAWTLPAGHQIANRLQWLAVPAEQLHTSLNWWGGHKHEIAHSLRYRGMVVGNEPSVTWGYTAPRWICSTKYRPPVGKVTLRLTTALGEGVSPVTLRFTPSPQYCYWDDGGGVIDGTPVLPPIDFKVPIEPQLLRYYLMQPLITCVRVSDGLPIVITSVSISHSRGQFARAVSLEFSSRIDAERAHNELLLISINGYDFYAIAEQPSLSKVFGSATYSSTGRSRVAELAAPYQLQGSYTNATARSFAGLLGDILQNSGWSVVLKGISDFTIPAGAFSVGNKTPIEAVAEAAAQLGCMILTDDAAKKLTIVPRWPTAPWNIAAAVPDLVLHDAVITDYSESVSRNPLCDVVWLRGEQQGINAKVKRSGSAGTIAAADISAQLIVDTQAARVAGTNALADTGDKRNISITAPIMADLPPATPGMLIGIREGAEVFKGTCDSVSIRASISARGDIDVQQTLSIIRDV